MEYIRGKLSTRKGEFDYQYKLWFHPNLKANVYSFTVWKEGDGIEPLYHFDFLLRVMENGEDLKVADMFAKAYRGKGISIAIILYVKKLFGKRIISASNKHRTYSGEANWQEAIEKVWKPLVRQQLARYDAKLDIYYLT